MNVIARSKATKQSRPRSTHSFPSLAMTIKQCLENIYISPLELCNLACLYCYTNKTKGILTNDQILSFVSDYKNILANLKNNFFADIEPGQPDSQVAKKIFENLPEPNLKSIIFCGGEVFTLKNFPNLINSLQSQGIFISVITNGTVDKLTEIAEPHNCQLIVSFDGPEAVHDANRGKGNFQKSLTFVRHALDLGFPVEIFYLITKDSFEHKDSLKIYDLHKTYLVDRLGSLLPDQVKHIRQNYDCYPSKNFGCSMFSLQSNRHFYGCCESHRSLGTLDDPLPVIVENFIRKIITSPLCSDPAFACGFQDELKSVIDKTKI